MKILYNTCIVDPFLQVAKCLQTKYGIEPVYWIGFTDKNTEELVKKELPGVPFQSYYDAWRGTFSLEIEEKANTCYLDVDLLNKLAHYEIQAYTMMNRLDINRYSFNTIERERHYLHFLKCWMACIELYKPDAVVSAVVPHRVYDYVLYILCEHLGIKYYTFNNTLSLEWSYITPSIYSIGDIFEKDYVDFLAKELTTDDLPEDIKRQYDRVSQQSYDAAAPSYMKYHNINDTRDRNVFLLFKRLYKKYGKTLFKTVPVNMFKKRDMNWKESKFSALELYKAKRGKIKYVDGLHKIYNTLVSNPVDGEKYILVSLHYQPEATSCPAGDLFANQQLIVETLLKHTPADYFIYVKEHPQQFQAHMNGHTSRIKEFYYDLASNPRVRLMPLELNSFVLMKNALAVATITGTVGWEAIMHGKPVIVFGLIWYEKMNGVLRITDDKSAEGIVDFISNYRYDNHKILAYLMAFAKNSINCYHYNVPPIVKEHISQGECVNNIVTGIARLVK